MTKDEALDLAQEWFQCYKDQSMSRNNAEALADEVVIAIKQALAAPDLQAELDATNRQVEILSDALAESRREVAAMVPDAFGTREGEHPQYIQGWNDCRAEMLRGKTK